MHFTKYLIVYIMSSQIQLYSI